MVEKSFDKLMDMILEYGSLSYEEALYIDDEDKENKIRKSVEKKIVEIVGTLREELEK